MLKPTLELGGGGHGGTTAKQGPRKFLTIHGSFRCCMQIAVCSRKPELPRQSTVPLTDENPTFHAVKQQDCAPTHTAQRTMQVSLSCV